MVRKNLLDIVTLSGIRKELLLYLDEGPRSLSEIREYLDITSPEVSPRIKELLEHNLVKYEEKKYKLTPMGKTIIIKFKPFLNTINVFDQYSDWWEEHDLSSIPEEMLYRIDEIKNFIIIEDDRDSVNRTNIELEKLVMSSKNLVGVSCIFDDSFTELFLNLAKKDASVSLVLTEYVFNIIDEKYHELIDEYLKTGNFAYILKGETKISHIVSNDCLYLSLFYKNGKFDFHSNLISNDPSSVKWGRDLFEYYRIRSKQIE